MPLIFANILQPLIDVFEHILTFFHDSVGFGWGMSIIAMTVVVRAAMIPLTLKQFHSMQGMQRLQPQIKALQAKYKDDRQRLNQEMMKFYQENKVNPFGSCLPLVLQMPVFISLFYMLRHDLRLDICPSINPPGTAHPKPCGATDAASFLGIPDLTNKATGITLIVLLVLYVGSQLFSSLLMSTTMVDKNQRMIMLGLPFVFVPFIIGFPAGLLVYWITTNIWTVSQQQVIKRVVGHQAPLEPGETLATANGTGGGGKGGGLFGALTARVQQASEKQAAEKDDGGPAKTATKTKAPPAVASGPRTPPPKSPRKKKKRSGRRR
jgi:YidC/Oxa1 family membrane protein insertase